MKKMLRALATAAGARTDADFGLFERLAKLRDQFRKLRPRKGPISFDGIGLLYDYYLTHGRFFLPQPLPKGFRRGRAKQCYHNSSRLSVFKEGLTYCEGYVLVRLGESTADVEHGWCVTTEGKVIDVTLKETGLSYFGVPYTSEEVATSVELPIIDAIIDRKLAERAKAPEPG